jgi:hypothetical protein
LNYENIFTIGGISPEGNSICDKQNEHIIFKSSIVKSDLRDLQGGSNMTGTDLKKEP